MMATTSDVQALAAGKIVELFELDLTPLGGEVERWHNGVNELEADIVWGGDTFFRLPIKATGFEKSSTGASPRPTVQMSNVFGDIAAAARAVGGFETAEFRRIKTFVKYLDAVNFSGGNPDADPGMKFPDEIYFIERKTIETSSILEFELRSSMDVAGVKLPRRQVLQNTCLWAYRGDECTYAGGPVADESDAPTADPDEDECGKRLASCKRRFGEFNPLPFGAFPGVGLFS